MDRYRRYQEARDTAWRALLSLEEKRLPADPEALARQVGAQVHPYPQSDEEPRLYALAQKAGGGVCVSLRIRGVWHILVRESALDGDGRRFAVAHELGHLLLGHHTRALAPGVRAFCSTENAGDLMDEPASPEDEAADMFAIRLLAPACLLHEMRVDAPGGIRRLCGLPPKAAALRAERMALLNERDAFFTHPLERRVRDAFLPFLREKGLASPSPAPLLPPPEAAPARPAQPAPRREAPPAADADKRCLPPAAVWAAALLLLAAALFLLLRP